MDTRPENFLSQYDKKVTDLALKLRMSVLSQLPGITETVDLPARMVAYTYGPKYADMICTIIPSTKGLKLGFYKGNELQDPEGWLEGTGKISRYVVIRSAAQVQSPQLKALLQKALQAYRQRTKEQK